MRGYLSFCILMVGFALGGCKESPAAARQRFLQAIANSDFTQAAKIIEEHPELAKATDDQGNAVLPYCIERAPASFIDLLLKNGANPASPQVKMVLTRLVANKASDPQILGLFLASGLNVDTPDERGATLLMHAARGANGPMIATLAKHGAKLNACETGDMKFSVLHYAVMSCDAAIVKDVVARGAPLDLLDAAKETPLQLAIWASTERRSSSDQMEALTDSAKAGGVKDSRSLLSDGLLITKRGAYGNWHLARDFQPVIAALREAGAK